MARTSPDWRKADDYRFPPGFPDHRWAWEFLRRNPEYRRDWNAALSRFLDQSGEFEVSSDPREFLRQGGSLVLTGEMWRDDPEDPGFYLPVDEQEKWGLRGGMLNPETNDPGQLSFDLSFGTVHFMRKGEKLTARGPAYPMVVFDLHLPLKPQLDSIVGPMERARKFLNIKTHRAKHHRRLWPRYLRMLDADLDQRTPKQIADALEHEIDGIDEKKVWDQLRAARKMILPAGYLSIFLSPPSD